MGKFELSYLRFLQTTSVSQWLTSGLLSNPRRLEQVAAMLTPRTSLTHACTRILICICALLSKGILSNALKEWICIRVDFGLGSNQIKSGSTACSSSYELSVLASEELFVIQKLTTLFLCGCYSSYPCYISIILRPMKMSNELQRIFHWDTACLKRLQSHHVEIQRDLHESDHRISRCYPIHSVVWVLSLWKLRCNSLSVVHLASFAQLKHCCWKWLPMNDPRK